MLKNIIRRILRQPLMGLAVVLFAAVLTVVLCYLHQSNQRELQSFEESYASVPVFFRVVNLDGSRPNDRVGIDAMAVNLFQKDLLPNNLKRYVEQAHCRTSLTGKYYPGEVTGNLAQDRASRKLIAVGISSTWVAEELTEGWGGKIYWEEGYDESILLSKEYVCLVPENMKDRQEIVLKFEYEFWPTGQVGDLGAPILMTSEHAFKVVGYYTDPGNTRIYCPYEAMAVIHYELRKAVEVEQIGAVLADNHELDLLKADAARWFATPNPMGEKTPWGRYGFEYFLFAMDIDDSMLINLEVNLKNSLRLNRLASAVVFALSAATGFLTGFLVIRSRKREISLMRTMGASHLSIFAELALEQVICISLGVGLGGSYTLWEPMQKLMLFGGIYFVGLAAALIVFLHKNLLTTMKEDE